MGFIRKHKILIAIVATPIVVPVVLIGLLVLWIYMLPDYSHEQSLDVGDGYVAEIYWKTFWELSQPVYCTITKDGREINGKIYFASAGGDRDAVFSAMQNVDGRYVAFVNVKDRDRVLLIYDKEQHEYVRATSRGSKQEIAAILKTFATTRKLYLTDYGSYLEANILD